MKTKYPLVYIEWEDSVGCGNGWRFLDDELKNFETVVCYTVGWLVGEDERCKFIAPHIAPETKATVDQIAGTKTIPKSAIRKLTKLKVPK